MDITSINNKYVTFNPNYLAIKKEQIKLAKLIKANRDEEYTRNLLNPSKVKVWRVENKKIKEYIPQDSKYDFKQIVKNFKLNREQKLNGYSNKYINIFTDLLYENNNKKYAKKRLSLVDFRKKILKKNLNTSFEEYIEKEPLTERHIFTKQTINNIYLTNVMQKLEKDKEKNKPKNKYYYSSKKETKERNKNKNRIFIKELFTESISNSNSNEKKLKLNLIDTNVNSVKIFSYEDTNQKSNNENINLNININLPNWKRNNLYDRMGNYCGSESNINVISNRGINNYTYKKDNNENIYFEKLTPKEEFIERKNKAKYIDFLKNKYNFYTSSNIKDLKNYTEIKKRQLLFDSKKDQIEHPLDFPYKKEFFHRFNRINSRNRIKSLIKEEIKSNELPIKYIKQKIDNN